MNTTINRRGIELDRALRAVHAAEREWVVAYIADAEDTPETYANLREAGAKVIAAKEAYAEALKAFDAALLYA